MNRKWRVKVILINLKISGKGAEGHGMTFTLGRGNEIIKSAVESLIPLVIGKDLREVTPNILEIIVTTLVIITVIG